jgi:hypothetical protein
MDKALPSPPFYDSEPTTLNSFIRYQSVIHFTTGELSSRAKRSGVEEPALSEAEWDLHFAKLLETLSRT